MGALWRNSYVRQRTRRDLRISEVTGTLADFDRCVLEYLTTSGSSEILARRARIILSVSRDGATSSIASRSAGVSLAVVALWTRRFLEHGLVGLVTAEGSAPDLEAKRGNGRYAKIFEVLDHAIKSVAPNVE